MKALRIKNFFLYGILWLAGGIVGTLMIVMWNRADQNDHVAVFDSIPADELRDNPSTDIVNELLLSANELNIYGKSSLIEVNRHEEGPAVSLLQQLRTNPENAYRTILRNKIEKLNTVKAGDRDFSVKPVPK
ncbi:MAG: hypothetical protein U0X40_09490 [Ferruginibacter sp.]